MISEMSEQLGLLRSVTIGLLTILSTTTCLNLYLPDLLTHDSNALPIGNTHSPLPLLLSQSEEPLRGPRNTTKPEQDIHRDKKRLTGG